MTANQADEEPQIEVARDGPLIVKGLTTFAGVDGEAIPTKPVMALCRCGHSAERPFCDGTHASIGFRGERQDDRSVDARRDYRGKRMTVHDNRGICSHAGDCTEKLPQVFRHGKSPWIDPDAASVEDIIEIIEMCPSGALSYSIDGVEHRDLAADPAVRIETHGPYRVAGGVQLAGVEWLEGASSEHYALCRCGHSKNKPFCDGRHWHAKYRDDGKQRVAMLSELESGQPLQAEVDGAALVVRIEDGRPVAATADGRSLTVTVEDRWGEVLVDVAEVHGSATSAAAPAEPTTDGNREEPHNDYIRHLAEHGLTVVGGHGPMAAMGVPRYQLPSWADLQFVTAQLHWLPQLDDVEVET